MARNRNFKLIILGTNGQIKFRLSFILAEVMKNTEVNHTSLKYDIIMNGDLECLYILGHGKLQTLSSNNKISFLWFTDDVLVYLCKQSDDNVAHKIDKHSNTAV